MSYKVELLIVKKKLLSVNYKCIFLIFVGLKDKSENNIKGVIYMLIYLIIF